MGFVTTTKIGDPLIFLKSDYSLFLLLSLMSTSWFLSDFSKRSGPRLTLNINHGTLLCHINDKMENLSHHNNITHLAIGSYLSDLTLFFSAHWRVWHCAESFSLVSK